jgi:tetratricopeptide (TPR) repeat protein
MTDLGLALAADDDEFKVTREGSTVGTLDYMSPEQARDSRSTDIRSDIYSLGCTAYHMLAGKPPFAEGGLGERLLKHIEVPPPDVRQFNPAVSSAFWAVLRKMLAKKPEERHATPGELLAELRRIPATGADTDDVDPPSRPARRPPPTPSSSEQFEPPAELADLSRRHSGLTPPPTPSPSSSEIGPSPVTPEQARAAAKFHERAVQVLAEGGGDDYARQLLGNCLKLDPFNPTYRQTLRELNRKSSGSRLGRWLGSLAVKARMRAARGSDPRKVLEHGEEVLARQPADVETHLAMAEAAERLGLPDLALWLLEQGREQAPNDPELLRALAALHERRKDWRQAIALWERVRRLQPDDHDIQRKINELSVRDHLARGLRR